MRVRVEYEKGPEIKYLSHLDLVRLWERLLRRSSLNVRLTQGFNPRFRLSLGTVLPVGVWGKREYLDFELEADYEIDQVRQELMANTPPGLRINRLKAIAPEEPSLMKAVNAASYYLKYPGELYAQLCRAIEIFRQSPVIKVVQPRSGKEVDIKPGLLFITVSLEDEAALVEAHLAAGQNATRLADLVAALEEQGVPERRLLDKWRESNYIWSSHGCCDPMDA